MEHNTTKDLDLSTKTIDNPSPIPEYILKEWIEKGKPLVDSAWNLALDEAVRVVEAESLGVDPSLTASIINSLNSLKNK